MSNTTQEYDQLIPGAKDIFVKKAKDYGTSWRVLRPISVADQIYIKARRIRQLQDSTLNQKIEDDIPSEFKGIINYAIIGLIQLQINDEEIEHLPVEECSRLYDQHVKEVKTLMEMKNHDYGEAWRDMSQESFVDLILMKLQRMRQILSNKGKTLISEGLDANYYDMINYAIFAMILLAEKQAIPV